MDDKDIRFTEKKVDESWKERATRDRGHDVKPDSPEKKQTAPPAKTSKPFLNLLNSLAMQTLMHLGELGEEVGTEAPVDTHAAQEIIDLILAVQEKAKGNLSSEEKVFFEQVIPQLQMKFAERAQ